MTAQQYYWNGIHVPYINQWTAEAVRQPQLIRIRGRGGEGIGYEDEDPVTDRWHEALWVRSGLARGRGRPDFARISSLRQKRAMRYSLCQVCEEPVLDSGADERTLHLLGGATSIGEGETTAAPPLHARCALESIEACRHLRRGWAAALVEYSPLWGVAGVVHDPVTLAPLPSPGRRPFELTHVPIGDERIRWTLASFTVVSLHRVTPVSLEELRAMAAEEERRDAADREPMSAA
ncbi:hypothetical protein [Streptomyces sp. TRM68367]|uniref:hypothetical protein n=1 Tax=Streptomyces sp. TRM68367 TaxID=2758415 RepID=UPI00165A5DCE|nr:hypothetical protein [Streptomyces sp. TRM68367]MBC9730347.1 hypothetical protein [Streptomyces sp. TRM68367]